MKSSRSPSFSRIFLICGSRPVPSSGGERDGLINDRRILDSLDLTVTTSWSVSTGIWLSASLVWRWRRLPGAAGAAVLAPPPMALARAGGRARRLVARAAPFLGESRPRGGRGRLRTGGCPSEKETRRGVVGAASLEAAPVSGVKRVGHAAVTPRQPLPLNLPSCQGGT